MSAHTIPEQGPGLPYSLELMSTGLRCGSLGSPWAEAEALSCDRGISGLLHAVGVRIALFCVVGSGMSVEGWRLRVYKSIRVVHLVFSS